MAKHNLDQIKCNQCPCNKNGVSFVWVSHELKAIWLENPKSASTSIKRALQIASNDTIKGSFDNPYGFFHLSLPRSRVLDISDYFVFGFCRNPWDRMVSLWKNFTTDKDRILLLKNRMGIANSSTMSLKQFVQCVHSHKSSINHHWQPQILFLPTDRMNIDYVGKFESIDESWNHVSQRLKINVCLKRMYPTNHDHYSVYYDDETRGLVEEMYPEDIKLFGYKYDQVEGENNESV